MSGHIPCPTEPVSALVWMGGQAFDQVALPLPELQQGEVLVRLSAGTICGSDRHTVSGRRTQPSPSILGHEGAGEVVASRRSDIPVGQRVTFSVTAPCLECARCVSGLTAKCERVLKTGHEPFNGPWPLSGTYATHILLRKNQPIVALPERLDPCVASVASCAGATVMAAVEAGVELAGKRVLVMGLGMLGLIAVDIAARGGAADIVAVDPDAQRRQWAEHAGAHRVLAPGELKRHAVDVSFEFSGVPAGVAECIRSLDIGGRAVLAGSVADTKAFPLDPQWLVRGWRSVTGVHNYEPQHLQLAVDSLAQSNIAWEEVISPALALHDVPVAFSSTAAARYLRELVIL